MSDITGGVMSPVRVYRVSKGYRILSAVLISPLIGLLGLVMAIPFLEGSFNIARLPVFPLLLGGTLALFLLLFFFYVLLAAFKDRLEIYADRIRNVCLFRTVELPIGEISGFRVITTRYTPVLLLLPGDC